jgi:chromosome segregation ATPase
VVGDNELELKLYRDKVVQELKRRTEALMELEGRLIDAQFELDRATRASRTISGTTARIQIENAHRVKLRSALRVLESERDEAKADLERAEQRLREVDQRLDELLKEGQEV